MTQVKTVITLRWFIRIQARPVGKKYKHSKYFDWPVLFRSREAAKAFFETCFTFKHLQERFPRKHWRLTASLECKGVSEQRIVT